MASPSRFCSSRRGAVSSRRLLTSALVSSTRQFVPSSAWSSHATNQELHRAGHLARALRDVLQPVDGAAGPGGYCEHLLDRLGRGLPPSIGRFEFGEPLLDRLGRDLPPGIGRFEFGEPLDTQVETAFAIPARLVEAGDEGSVLRGPRLDQAAQRRQDARLQRRGALSG